LVFDPEAQTRRAGEESRSEGSILRIDFVTYIVSSPLRERKKGEEERKKI
jgi:hypothetical protein